MNFWFPAYFLETHNLKQKSMHCKYDVMWVFLFFSKDVITKTINFLSFLFVSYTNID